MGPVSVTADAGLDILRQLASGELEVHGILLRDTIGKKFRYILRGLEDLPADPASINSLPPLDPLRSALNMPQLLQAVTIAQNVAMAASLRRIEASLTRIESRLGGIEARLTRIETQQTLLLSGTRSAPASRLVAAKTAAVIALRAGDRTALIAAGQSAEEAARDLTAQARHLIRVQENGLPIALIVPAELADLSEAAADASRVASAIWLTLDARNAAKQLMAETADGLEAMRRQLAAALRDPELAIRRAAAPLGTDADLATAGKRLQAALYETRGREQMILAGLLVSDPSGLEFEKAEAAQGLSIHPLPD
ncbi:hypothetical protein [Roseomonas mucosa]|nr:hypothetical protein [Acetobacteraceae bacterium]